VNLYDFAPIAYFTFDLFGCIQEVNLTGATLIGRDRAQLIGVPFVSLVELAEPAQFWSHLRRCAETRTPTTTELALTVQKATTQLRAISSPVTGPGDRIIAFRTAFIDITDRYQAIRSRDNLLATVSHDLRSPLSAIAISAKLLLRMLASEEASARKQAETISHAAERMSRFIDDLLTASTIEAGHLTVTRRPDRIEAIIGETIETFAAIGAESSLQLDVKLASGLPEVLCDRDRIQQILANLVGNATKFTPPGGRITIEAARHGDEVQISVIDTGPGIPDDIQLHVFERYWKGGPGANSRRGVGLGLYICKGIVDSHKGRIWVESTPGRGAKFTFSIPVAGESAGQ
jgi:signal transduction histidine kinase